jgi:hypothetical protein
MARQRTALSDAVHLLVRPRLDVDPVVRNLRNSRPEALREAVCGSKDGLVSLRARGQEEKKAQACAALGVPLDTYLSGVVFRSLTRLSFILSLIGDTLGFCIRTTS